MVVKKRKPTPEEEEAKQSLVPTQSLEVDFDRPRGSGRGTQPVPEERLKEIAAAEIEDARLKAQIERQGGLLEKGLGRPTQLDTNLLPLDVQEAIRTRQLQTGQEVIQETGGFQDITSPEGLVTQPGSVGPKQIGESLAAAQGAIFNDLLLDAGYSGQEVNSFNTAMASLPEAERLLFMTGLIVDKIKQDGLRTILRLNVDLDTQIEAIPVVGTLARKFAGGILPTNSRRADNIFSTLENLETPISELDRIARVSPETAFEGYNGFEQRLNELESKLQILALQSPELLANPEELDKIEEKINGVRLRIIASRQIAQTNLIAQREGVTLGEAELIFQTLQSTQTDRPKGL